MIESDYSDFTDFELCELCNEPDSADINNHSQSFNQVNHSSDSFFPVNEAETVDLPGILLLWGVFY